MNFEYCRELIGVVKYPFWGNYNSYRVSCIKVVQCAIWDWIFVFVFHNSIRNIKWIIVEFQVIEMLGIMHQTYSNWVGQGQLQESCRCPWVGRHFMFIPTKFLVIPVALHKEELQATGCHPWCMNLAFYLKPKEYKKIFVFRYTYSRTYVHFTSFKELCYEKFSLVGLQ